MSAFTQRALRQLPSLAGSVFQDLRYAWRMMKRSPGVTAGAVVSLALGIGANTAIFTLIESTLLRPIAVKDLDRLRLLQWREQDGGWTAPNLGYLSAASGSIYEQGVTSDDGIIHTDFSPRVYWEFVRSNTVFDSLFTFKELATICPFPFLGLPRRFKLTWPKTARTATVRSFVPTLNYAGTPVPANFRR